MSFKWIKVHTHTHTLNSDGKDTLRDMAYAARRTSVDAMFLTDHNTMAAAESAHDISKETGVHIIKGIEYTTFYGHIVVVGAPYYRWESLTIKSLNDLADYVHKYNGIIGIAHPRGLGDPACTGGSYSFIDVDFSKIDFIEVWHGVTDKFNEWEKNKNLWINRLDEGRKITAVYGGDFHKKEHFEESNAFNWLLIDTSKHIEDAIKEAIKAGRVVMSKGPCFNMKIQKHMQIYNIGETIESEGNDNPYNILFDINWTTIKENIIINLVDNCGKVKEVKYSKNNKVNIEIHENNERKWIRAEILDDINKHVLAISNPIYFK
ncbi:CehA/McbA family metallohydrolase [Clostridium sp. DJ247]|uniref:CehA/McbA family metallohydrolase n=1 Tax=Clostridium sp. DJ247 TaxID=2726188 RepID=UPI001628F93E|nr:CehA/McbA family metallohydrolase [Clostridium sp. DJ247]MBC2581496.1 CehA/McbA family metallohydrolase [Clostridium sp. DJ247]